MGKPEMVCNVEQLNKIFEEHGEEIFEKMTNVLSEYTKGCRVTAVTVYPEEDPSSERDGPYTTVSVPSDGYWVGPVGDYPGNQ